eukprot:5571604-Ditylum_brightwellii.AAC.1
MAKKELVGGVSHGNHNMLQMWGYGGYFQSDRWCQPLAAVIIVAQRSKCVLLIPILHAVDPSINFNETTEGRSEELGEIRKRINKIAKAFAKLQAFCSYAADLIGK